MIKVIIFDDGLNLQRIRYVDEKRGIYCCYSDGRHNANCRVGFKEL